MKGGEFSNISNGDLVILTANKYAIQPGGDGTGPLGISVWGAGKNWTPGSEALSGADWTVLGGAGAATPTVTANFATAPDNAATAERIQFGATTAGQYSFIYANAGCSGNAGAKSMSCFVRGNGTSGTMDIAWGGGAGGWDWNNCAFVSGSWTRCRLPSATAASATLFAIGNMTLETGNVRAANDALVWGCQCEDGESISPYMPTAVGSTATRAAENGPTRSFTAANGALSLRATAVAPFSFSENVIPSGASWIYPAVSVDFNASNEFTVPITAAKNRCDFNIADTHSYLQAKDNYLNPAPQTAASCGYASGARSSCAGSNCKSTAGVLVIPTGAATIRMGGLQDGGVANATVRNICVDNSGTVCNPSGSAPVTCPAVVAEAQQWAGVGNSILVGNNSPSPLTFVADEMNDRMCASGLGVQNFAVSGAQIFSGGTSCSAQYTNSIKGHQFRGVFTNCGVNDVVALGDGNAAYLLLESFLYDVVHDGGFNVVLGNVVGCQGYSGCLPAQVDIMNARELSLCADAGSRVTCLNHHALLGASSSEKFNLAYANQNDLLGTMCNGGVDHIHPGGYCTVRMADSFADNCP